MASQVIGKGPRTPGIVMTPLIDVVLQLIIFFLLASRVTAIPSARMIVPKLTDDQAAREPSVRQLTVNVVPQAFGPERFKTDDPLMFSGEPSRISIGSRVFAIDDAAGIVEALAEAKEKNPELTLVLRADGALEYRHVRRIQEVIVAAGIEQVELAAYLPRPEGEAK